MSELARLTNGKKLPLLPIYLDGVRRKQPATFGSWKHESRITPMREEEFQDYGFGLECGGLPGWFSGYHAIDFDHEAESTFPAFWEKVSPELREKLYLEKSPKGFHIIGRFEMMTSGNTVLARLPKEPGESKGKVLIETRSSGGYIIIAPTPGYEHLSGPKLHELEKLDYGALTSLHKLALSFNRDETPEEKQPKKKNAVKQEYTEELNTPAFECWNPWVWIARYANQYDWKYLLTECGWVEHSTDSDGRIHFTRPGKSTAEGISGNLFYEDLPDGTRFWSFYCHSSTAMAVQGYNWYSFFQQYETELDREDVLIYILSEWFRTKEADSRLGNLKGLYNYFN